MRFLSCPDVIALFATVSSVLQQNPLQPPRPFTTTAPQDAAAGIPAAVRPAAGHFVSAEDFDATGILAGVDPCESRYWWMPELYGPQPLGGHAMDSRIAATTAADPRVSYAARRPATPAAA